MNQPINTALHSKLKNVRPSCFRLWKWTKTKVRRYSLIWNSQAYSFDSLSSVTKASKGVPLLVNIGCFIVGKHLKMGLMETKPNDFLCKDRTRNWSAESWVICAVCLLFYSFWDPIPLENVRKPEGFFTFQGIWRRNIDVKLVNLLK